MAKVRVVRGANAGAVRIGLRTLISIALCAAFGAAALAHYAIDVVGDFALAHDSYDDVVHSSRDIVTAIALLLASALAVRGLRACCELAAASRGHLPATRPNRREAALFVLAVIGACVLLVPAMECLDGRLGGMPVRELGAAFGGSIALGLSVSAACAAAIGLFLYSIAQWLISHRDAIATIIETLLHRSTSANELFDHDLSRHLLKPRRRRTAHALRLCKRGPPHGGRHLPHHADMFTEGDLRENRIYSRFARARRACDNAELCGTRLRGAAPYRAPR